MSTSSFADLGVSAPVAAALAGRGIASPFPIQTLVVPDAIAGNDVLARSQTGTGKTLAFGLPIVERTSPGDPTPCVLVLAPTRELARQVAEEIFVPARARGLRVGVVHGGVVVREQTRSIRGAQILVATPGRLEDLAERRRVRLDGVRILVLDEADRMLDMGFQPQVDRLVRRLPAERQTMLFSATLDGGVARLAASYTRSPRRHEVESDSRTVAEVEHRFVPVPSGDKVDALVEILGAQRALTLVFVRTKRGADRLVRKLGARGVRAEVLHGDMTQPARTRALAHFGSGRVDVLVATDVAARGLDLDGISHVVNFDPPEDDKGYLHRVGRTGRAGRGGTGVTLVTSEQERDVSRLAARLDLEDEFRREGMAIAAPRVVFSGSVGGRRSSLRRRPRRAL
ncbi:MAG TPA: DEAD/DEAH box helicase [Actinomycetota bacterium]|nr:DEAD/DEAH box helicase [Actinomycetota bacterium]